MADSGLARLHNALGGSPETFAAIAAEDTKRAAAYSATRFEAFRICEAAPAPYGGPPPRTTYALGDIPATSLDEALNATLGKCLLMHKEHLAIRETNDRGARVHLYAIKRKSAPDYRRECHRVVREHRLYAAHLCTIDGGIFA